MLVTRWRESHDIHGREEVSSLADITVSFNNEQDSVKDKLPKIRGVVKPYLGKSEKLTVRGDKITANFKVPFASKENADFWADKVVAKLVLDNGRIQLVEADSLKALNRDLAAIWSDTY